MEVAEESSACQDLHAGTKVENTHARLKGSPTTDAEMSVVSSGLRVMLWGKFMENCCEGE